MQETKYGTFVFLPNDIFPFLQIKPQLHSCCNVVNPLGDEFLIKLSQIAQFYSLEDNSGFVNRR